MFLKPKKGMMNPKLLKIVKLVVFLFNFFNISKTQMRLLNPKKKKF